MPQVYEVHFSNYERGDSTTQVCLTNEVAIPDAYLQTGLDIYVWIYFHSQQNDGETEYFLTIPVIKRATITEEEPTQQQVSVIQQTIAALNSAASTITTSTAAAVSAAQDAENYRGVTRVYMQTTQGYKEAAESAYNSINTAIGDGYITIGQTRLTEDQLKSLLGLIEED